MWGRERNAISAHWRKQNRKVLIRSEIFEFSIKTREMSTAPIPTWFCPSCGSHCLHMQTHTMCARAWLVLFVDNMRVNFQTESLTPHFHFNFLISFPLRLVDVDSWMCVCLWQGHTNSPTYALLYRTHTHSQGTYDITDVHIRAVLEFNQITIYYCVWWVLAVRETIQKVKFKYLVVFGIVAWTLLAHTTIRFWCVVCHLEYI